MNWSFRVGSDNISAACPFNKPAMINPFKGEWHGRDPKKGFAPTVADAMNFLQRRLLN